MFLFSWFWIPFACILLVPSTEADKLVLNGEPTKTEEATSTTEKAQQIPSFRNVTIKGWSLAKDHFEIASFTGNLDPSSVIEQIGEIRIIKEKVPILYKGAVKDLHKLYFLKLTHDAIKEVLPGAFQNLPELLVMLLYGNEISEVKEGVFGFLNVSRLDLSSNRINTIYPNAFNGMTNLTELDLSSNQITTVYSRTFKGLRNLDLLYMNDNKINVWDPKWFEDTPKISRLDFSQNEIESLPAHAFKSITKDYYFQYGSVYPKGFIKLSKNKIKTIDPTILSDLDKVDVLDLGDNLISELEPGIFSSLENVRLISLLRNQIQCLSSQFLDTVPHGSYNRENVFRFDENPWNCTCLEEVDKWNEEHKRVISIAKAKKICINEKIRKMGFDS